MYGDSVRKIFRRFRSSELKLPKKVERLSSVVNFIKSYMKHTSIHGFPYVVNETLTMLENIFWLLLVGAAITCCVIISLQSLQRYKTKSTMMGLECDYNYWNTTLPSLTVCPTERLSLQLFEKFCSEHDIQGDSKDALFQYLETLANATFQNFHLMPYNDISNALLHDLHIEPNDYMSLIYNLTEDLSLIQDSTKRLRADFYLSIRQILTEFGICYIINTYLSHKYSATYFIHGVYPAAPIDENKIDYIATLSGTYFDVTGTYMVQEFHTDIVTHIHSPFETMRVDVNRNHATTGIVYDTEVHEIVVDGNLQKRTTPAQRNCRFQNETYLTNFPIYTKNLCMQQCRLNLAMHLCNCIPHFYPNRIEKPKPVCSYRQLRTCMAQNSEFLLNFFDEKTKEVWPCECAPNCRDSVVITSKPKLLFVSGDVFDFLPKVYVLVRTFKWPLFRYKRQIIFSVTDLLVSIGGTAGLFLGFSVLGAIEFFYFFTMHLVFTIWKKKF